ncbi:MAG: hypothetical protein AB8B81_17915 [Halioglobus sp.]
MNSITNEVKMTYGLHDVQVPQFQCPVVVDPTLLQMIHGSALRVETLVSGAAAAVELVSRFESRTQFVQFSCAMARPIAEQALSLRVVLVNGRLGNVARIECSPFTRSLV